MQEINNNGNTNNVSVAATADNEDNPQENRETVTDMENVDDDEQVASLSLSVSSMNVSDPGAQNVEETRNINVHDGDTETQHAILESINQTNYVGMSIDLQNESSSSTSSNSSSSEHSSSFERNYENDCILIRSNQIYTERCLDSLAPITRRSQYKDVIPLDMCCICHESREDDTLNKK